MQATLFDRLILVALMVASVLVVFLMFRNRELRKGNDAMAARLTRLEEHRGALDAYQAASDAWEQEKKAEQVARLSATEWRTDVMRRLDSIAAVCSGTHPPQRVE